MKSLLTNFQVFLQIWENYVEGQEVSNGSPSVPENQKKEVLKVFFGICTLYHVF